MKQIFSATALALTPLVWAVPAQAASIGVQPLIVEVSPGQSAAVRVRNSSDEPTSVETFVAQRIIDTDGVQTRKDADDEFIVFPPQGTVAPQGTQVFRIQPIGSSLTESKSYFLTVQQIPVSFAPTERTGGAQVQVVFAFDVAVHVVPRGAKPNLELVSATPGETTITIPPPPEALVNPETPPTPTIKTVPAAVIEIRNLGNRYLYLQNYDFVVTATLEDGSIKELPVLTEREVIDAAGVTLVLPSSSRTFRLPLPEGTKARAVSIQVRERQSA